MNKLQLLVYQALQKMGEGTADDIEELTGLKQGTIRPRLQELEKHGRVVQTDEEVFTKRRRRARVWRVK